MRARSRFAASIVVALALSVGASGCAFITPQATTSIKEAADGVEGNVDPNLSMRNVTLISDDGKTASLIATLVNTDTTTGILVNIQYVNAAGTTVTENAYVNKANESGAPGKISNTVTIGGVTDSKIIFTGLDVKAGTLFPVYFQYGNETGTKLLVPVLTSDWPQFKGLAPADAAIGG
ncbi:hypothetical protein [Subtercola endophyticus]|uniref:hypothetical protein n=1 Tax=Subtercola endophyticus TaxID=2895559 RepID=UPI001E3B8DA6|nr:hypothetical protein [Subtercola endophyticus]UFS59524.1 hypothetical protein LQ955_01605 [Subtercola endophyticus]